MSQSLMLLSGPVQTEYSFFVSSFESLVMPLIQIIFTFLFLVFITLLLIGSAKSKRELFNHWNVLMYDMKTSTGDFYTSLQTDLKEHGVTGLEIIEKDLLVGNVVSHKRKYLRVSYRDFTYDICGAPFGKSFFVSYWMYGQMKPVEFAIYHMPFGKRLHRLMFPQTYYTVDTSNMFHQLIHDVIMERIDALADEQKLERLTKKQKIPVMKDVFKR